MQRQQAIETITQALPLLNDNVLDALQRLVQSVSLSASGVPYTGDAETDEVLDDPKMISAIKEHEKVMASSPSIAELKQTGYKSVEQVIKEQGINVEPV